MGEVKAYSGFINLSYKPGKNDFVAEYFLEAADDTDFETAAQGVAGESSIGTWTEIGTLTPDIIKRLKPSIFEIEKDSAKSGIVKIAYPGDLFEAGSVPQLMSSIAGNVFGMSIAKNLRLLDIGFPDWYIKSFKGPEFGIPGVRKLLRVKDRPLVGTIIKPKIGLDEKGHAKVAYNAWLGGCDIVKDDENLTDMKFNKFEPRVKETLRLRDKVEKETGEKKVYMANVTAETSEMLKRAKFVKDSGGEYAMVDIITCGWSSLQTLRDSGLKLVLHAHRAGHAAFTRNPKHGISMLVIAKLCRLIGMDQLHVGAIFGKMEGGKEEVQAIGEDIERNLVIEDEKRHRLQEDWLGMKPMFAVCSGGLHPGKVSQLVGAMGNDIIIQMGGGIHGHPQGTIAGAKAARQAVDAAVLGITPEQHAKLHKELDAALKLWGR